MNKRSGWLASLALSAAACTGGVTLPGGAGGAGGGSTGSVACPATEPAGGTCPATQQDLRCTYGDSVRPECRHDWICSSGHWATTKGLCLEPPAGHCDFMQPPIGQVCTNMGDVCTIGQSICECNACASGPCQAPPIHWTCAGPPATSGCPATVPNDGTGCAENGLSCTYGNPCGASGTVVQCVNGAWLWDKTTVCPA